MPAPGWKSRYDSRKKMLHGKIPMKGKCSLHLGQMKNTFGHKLRGRAVVEGLVLNFLGG